MKGRHGTFTEEMHFPISKGKLTHQRQQGGGLSCSVRPQQRHNLTRVNPDRDVANRGRTAIARGDVPGFEDGTHIIFRSSAGTHA